MFSRSDYCPFRGSNGTKVTVVAKSAPRRDSMFRLSTRARSVMPEAREALEADLYLLLDKFNTAEDGTLVLPSEYLEVVITKKS